MPAKSPPERLWAAGKVLKDWGRRKYFSPPSPAPSGRPEHPRAGFSLGRRREGAGSSREPSRGGRARLGAGSSVGSQRAGSPRPLAFSLIELADFINLISKFFFRGWRGGGGRREGEINNPSGARREPEAAGPAGSALPRLLPPRSLRFADPSFCSRSHFTLVWDLKKGDVQKRRGITILIFLYLFYFYLFFF